MNSYLTDLTLSHFEVEHILASELMNELRGVPHYTKSNGDTRWPSVASELYHKVMGQVTAKLQTMSALTPR